MKETLMSLVAQSNAIVAMLAESCGELTPEMETSLLKIETELPEKIDSYSYLIERLESESEFWKAKAEFYSKIGKSCSTLQKKLRDSVKSTMLENGLNEISGNDIKFKLSKSKASLEIDETKLDKSYFNQVVSMVVDKERVKDDLTNGVPVEGASLTDTFAMRVYPNKRETK